MTLIELLIAVTLVALLSTGMLMAIRLGLSSMEKTTARLYDNRRIISVNRILDSQIAGLMMTRADCFAGGVRAGAIPFFQGEPQTMRFVSTYSLEDAARGYPNILEFQVIPGERDGLRLIVNQHLYAGPASTGRFCVGIQPNPLAGNQPTPVFAPVAIGSGSFVLADRLEICRLSYRESLPNPPFERWLPVWVKATLPTAIRIEMVPLPEGRTRLPLVTVVAPVRITRLPELQYDAN